MYNTTYYAATSLDDAVAKLKADEEAKFLGGGQTLIATMKQRLAAPTMLIDVTKIPELKGIAVEGNRLVIGAASKHSEVSMSAIVKGAVPSLSGLAATIGDPAVRNMGTMGGSLANNDPAADYPAAAMALDAVFTTTKGEHKAVDFFQGIFETALEDDEIIIKISYEIPKKAAYEKFRNPASRYSLCSVFVAELADGPRVAVTGSGNNGVFRVPEMEAALASNWSPDAVTSIRIDPETMLSDMHGSAEYRAHLVSVLAGRAVAKAG
ncbi:FAD binding domain-containing protein [Acuticoccus sediminis]|uniref:FAD binding domain-containing protein n=1 Tax=Acuticoccus sediminis TaxID=2184697 RepID=UPI001CFC754D|nr:FAD binding domain-containing protein [Acuticoccus sediminis]